MDGQNVQQHDRTLKFEICLRGDREIRVKGTGAERIQTMAMEWF